MNPATFDPGPLADVQLVASGDRWTLVFIRDLRHPLERVWSAITDPAQLRDWAPFTADRDLGAIGDATLTMIDGNEAQDVAASVRHASPPTLLEYSWGSDLLRWELAGHEGGTLLTLRHTIDSREDAPKYAAGWHLCLAVAERLLDGNPIGPIVGRTAMNYGWDELRERYAAHLHVTSATPS